MTLRLPVLAASLMVALMVAIPCAQSQEMARARTIFFGSNLGLGAARIHHPAVSAGWRLGPEYDASFGLGLAHGFAFGFELATWQPPNIPGDPTHVHVFAPRAEFDVGAPDGLVVATALGLSVGDGRKTKRLGIGSMAQLTYRFALDRWITLGPELGARVAIYGDGTAVSPYISVQLRFWGASELWTAAPGRSP